jgi:hypothetical protein
MLQSWISRVIKKNDVEKPAHAVYNYRAHDFRPKSDYGQHAASLEPEGA